MTTTKPEGLLHFEANSNLVTQECFPAKVIVEAICHCSFFIFVSDTSTKHQHLDVHKIMGRLNDDISTLVSTEATQKSSKDEELIQGVVGTINSIEELSPSAFQNRERSDWRKLIVIPEG